MPTTWNDTLTQNHYVHYFLNSVPINGNDTVDYSATGIAGIKQIGTTTYVVLWGRSGTKGEIALRLKSPPSPVPASPWQWNAAANQAYLAFTYPPVDDSVTEASVIETSGQTLKLLIVDSAQGNRTWIDTNFIACGSSYMDANDSSVRHVGRPCICLYRRRKADRDERLLHTFAESSPNDRLELAQRCGGRTLVQ